VLHRVQHTLDTEPTQLLTELCAAAFADHARNL
jgi:hypothetical protein